LIILVHSIGLYFESFGLIFISTMLPVKAGDNKSPGKLTKVEKTETSTSSYKKAKLNPYFVSGLIWGCPAKLGHPGGAQTIV
jgi:hypothetical protein